VLDFINPSVQQTNSVVRSHDPAPSVPPSAQQVFVHLTVVDPGSKK
jgi:hypothetical protein